MELDQSEERAQEIIDSIQNMDPEELAALRKRVAEHLEFEKATFDLLAQDD